MKKSIILLFLFLAASSQILLAENNERSLLVNDNLQESEEQNLQATGTSFDYGFSTDLVSCYIWRGLYNGGLSLQPDVYIGFSNENISFTFDIWGNIGASDWGFRSGLKETDECNPNTQFLKEFDMIATLNLWGAILGLSHYYFFDGESFFNFGKLSDIKGSAQTEFTVGYDFSHIFPNTPLAITWNTMFSGDDSKDKGKKRAYSTYIEATYSHEFNHNITLSGALGISPWKSMYTDKDEDNAKDFALNNITVRADKTWALSENHWNFSTYLQGTVNTCNLNGDTAIIKASGDNILNKQKLMFAIGCRIEF